MTRVTSSVGILGLGQIGGSIAATLTRSGSDITIVGYDRRPELLSRALETGTIIEAARSAESLIEAVDTVIIALPVDGILSIMQIHAEALRAKIAVTDTGSLKGCVLALAVRLQFTNFVGGHPLAGTEKRGIESWQDNLFAGAPYLTCVNTATEVTALLLITAIIQRLGARHVVVDAIEHDRVFALTSGLPHILAYCLEMMYDQESAPNDLKATLRGPSFVSATRVAASDREMVFQLLWHNRHNLLDRLEELVRTLEHVRDSLHRGNDSVLRSLLMRESSPLGPGDTEALT